MTTEATLGSVSVPKNCGVKSAIRLVTMLSIAAAGAGCGDDPSDAAPTVIRVPTDAASIAGAVGLAGPGDTIEIAAGTYSESVNVTVPGITIRGVDRNDVVLDGGHALSNGFNVTADGVAIENLTVHSFTQNGLLFNGAAGELGDGEIYGTEDAVLVGYRASYVTAYNNGLYGIYAFSARDGLIEHSYVSGHPDSGVYVGQCKPCDVVIDDVVAERNAIGYYGTNSSGGVYVVNSVFRNNRLGLAPNSQKVERLSPQSETVVAGNIIADNDDPVTPAIQGGFFGGGVAVGGGTRNTIVRNRIEGNDLAGILIVSLGEFPPRDNVVVGNLLVGNGIDLVYAPDDTTTSLGNCMSGNTFTTSMPADIETVLGCPGGEQPVEVSALVTIAAPPGVDYRTIAAPGSQPTMPGSRTPTGGAGVVPPAIDIEAIAVPADPSG